MRSITDEEGIKRGTVSDLEVVVLMRWMNRQKCSKLERSRVLTEKCRCYEHSELPG